MFSRIEKAIADLKAGKMIIVVDDEDRENEGDFVTLAEHATPEAINFMATFGRGLICTPMTAEYTRKFGLEAMVNHNTDAHGTAFTVSVDHQSTHTGISAYERSITIQKFLDKETVPSEFKRPGHVFPLIAQENGVLEREGHTEAAVDLAILAGSQPVGVICEIMKDDGTMARLADLEKMAVEHSMAMITIQDLITYRKKSEKLINKEVEINLPTSFGQFKMAAFTEKITGKEHLAIYKGELDDTEPVLVRIHSECLTGDVFGSYRCDCGPQLDEALNKIEAAGKGVLVYMRQEGRGIGLVNKLKAYQLQEQGYDTVEANHQLGFADDLREYSLSAQILSELGLKKIKLLTNNPRKITALKEYGLEIEERVSIQIPHNKENEHYLKTKVSKLDHLLNF
ncbi:bifunctional 3,4-dihydroxy-2-butanone-4-phosphate synthase/GTP cyclohydrolase II [Aquibacillus kalidii]|uniref:bifunctional 3,4-dihydroxy-2-butanone-4-phosphate synthase/GTP cyclohydrolase II n=1 Tax=Aquibacillus kalidii TaxID=2762597 RepID=UPI0016489988|nr:bifunctional 3,4-dihydroxy-2-butanone-4-phosphate synthase/GTP cyclohydrolase II [Aquibacillus kalidii]